MSSLPASVPDLAVLGVVVISGLLAAMRGFTQSVFSLIVWLGAALAAIYGYGPFRPLADLITDHQLGAALLTACALFLVALIALNMLRGYVVAQVQDSSAGPLDRALGFLFGAARGVFILCLVYILAAFIQPASDWPDSIRKARAFPHVQQASSWLVGLLPASVEGQAGTLRTRIQTEMETVEAVRKLGERLNNPQPVAPDQKLPDTPKYSEQDRSELDSLIEENQ